MPKSLHSRAYKVLTSTLVDARKTAGLTQQELGNKLRRPQSFVAKYEGGERRIDIIELIEICQALEQRPEKLLKTLLRRLDRTA